MPTREESRARAKSEKLQAHPRECELTGYTYYVVYNVKRGTSYEVRPVTDLAGNVIRGSWICNCPWQRHGGSARGGPCKHVTRVLDKENQVHLTCTGCQRKVETKTKLKRGHCAPCRILDRMGFE